MKSIPATLMFICFGFIGYAQSTFPLPKVQGQKNPLVTSKNFLTAPGIGCSSKTNTQNHSQGLKPDVSVISIIPTLRLWLLPANFPNPFVKEDD